jgi:outer membrane lipopolysaccharide assembly protein LptE/RlpB
MYEIKDIAKTLKRRGFTASELDAYGKEAEKALIEALLERFTTDVVCAMEQLEEQELDAERGKPKTRAEWEEYIGGNNE